MIGDSRPIGPDQHCWPAARFTKYFTIYRAIILSISTYDSGLQRAKISLRNIVANLQTLSDDLTILQVNHTEENLRSYFNF